MVIADLIELDFDTPSRLPSLGIYKVGLHFIQIFFAFITFCIVVPIISIEIIYLGASDAAPNFTLVVTVISMFVAAPLALFPWSRFRGHLTSIRYFFIRPRTTLIFTVFMSLGWFVAMISMTVHANDASNCTLNAKLQKSDSSYTSAWIKQCNSAKAAAAFSWFCFFLWLPTAVSSGILLWHEKKLRHEEALTTPSAPVEEDARTIVDMEYSEKDKQPVAHYDGDDRDPFSPSISRLQEIQDCSKSEDYPHPLLTSPSAPPMATSSFTSPYVPEASVLGSPYPGYNHVNTPNNLISTYTPNVGLPYSVPASIINSPYPQQQVPSPFAYHQDAALQHSMMHDYHYGSAYPTSSFAYNHVPSPHHQQQSMYPPPQPPHN